MSPHSRWLCPLIWTWYSTMHSSPSPTSCEIIDHRAIFTDSTKRPHMLCVFIAKCAPNGIRLGAIWRSLLMILLTPAFCCVVCLPIACITVPVPVSETWFDSKPPSLVELTCLWVWDTHPPWPVAWLCRPSSAAPFFDASALPHCLFRSLDYFCQNFPKVSADMTTTSTCCPLLALLVQAALCLRPSLLDPDSVPCAWLVTIPLEAALHQVLRILKIKTHPVFLHFDWAFKTFQT